MVKTTPIMSSLKILQITYQTPYENLQGTPTSLPTSEPAVSQIIYTVSVDDLPTLNMGVESKINVALMFAGGRNTDVATRTVYWRMVKNGSSVVNGSFSVSAGYYWTIILYFIDVAVGDTLELRLWATDTAVNWDYEARQLQYSRIKLLSKYLLLHFSVASVDIQPILALGNPSYSFAGLYIFHYVDLSNIITSAFDFSPWKQSGTRGLFNLYYGDISTIVARYRTHSTYRPYYYNSYIPTEIRLRALKEIT